jgi:uncharacterized protein (TIGR02145 family)
VFTKDQLKRVFELLPDSFSEEQLLILLSEIDQINPAVVHIPWESISIGNQVWAAQNFSETHFQNGDEIPYIEDDELWEHYGLLGKPAWCYYNNDPSTEPVYGRLYNWHAATDPRGIAPKGWKIPSDSEWEEMEKYLEEAAIGDSSGFPQIGLKLKGKQHWKDAGRV